MTFLIMLSAILLSMLIIILDSLSVMKLLIYGNNWRWLLDLNLTYMTFWTESANDLLISVLEKANLFHLTGTIKLF